MNEFERKSGVRTVEIKRIDPKSMVKVMLYMMVPIAVVIILLAILAAISSAAFMGQNGGLGAFFGVKVMVGFLGIMVFEILLVAILSFIIALIYNLFSSKFGGLVMDLNESQMSEKPLEGELTRTEQEGSRYV